MRRTSIRWRLTAWYTVLLSVLLAVAAVASLIVMYRVLATQHDRFLDEARGAYLAELGVEYDELGTTLDAARAAVRDTRFNETWVFVFAADGRQLARSDAGGPRGAHLAPLAAIVADSVGRLAASTRADAYHTLESDDESYRLSIGPTVVGGEDLVVATMQSRAVSLDTVRQVATAYLIAAPLAILLCAIGGYSLARRALAPMAAMAADAREIEATNLDARLVTPVPNDEVGVLASVINDLLGRLEAAFAQQRRFVADASHELRTPVAAICAEADVALAVETQPESAYRESLAVIRGSGRRLARIVEELFLLARIDAGQLPLSPEPIYLGEVLAEVTRSMRPVAAGRDVTLVTESSSDAPITADARLVERLLLNLLDNAIRYAPGGSTVTTRLERRDGTVTVAVTDDGPGVPADARERVFERFYRVDPSRARSAAAAGNGSGAGLGLAIGRWIAEAHGGSLVLVDRAVGSEFVITLPARPH